MSYNTRYDEIIRRYKEAKNEKIRLVERQKVCLEEMRKTYKVDNAEELSVLLAKTTDKVNKLESKIEPMLDKLEEALNI